MVGVVNDAVDPGSFDVFWGIHNVLSPLEPIDVYHTKTFFDGIDPTRHAYFGISTAVISLISKLKP